MPGTPRMDVSPSPTAHHGHAHGHKHPHAKHHGHGHAHKKDIKHSPNNSPLPSPRTITLDVDTVVYKHDDRGAAKGDEPVEVEVAADAKPQVKKIDTKRSNSMGRGLVKQISTMLFGEDGDGKKGEKADVEGDANAAADAAEKKRKRSHRPH